jgi:Uma2 family endonuclease
MVSQVLIPIADPQLPEQRIRLDNVSWAQYETLLLTLGNDFPALRLSFLEGTLEIMTTSALHEEIKVVIRLLLEAFFFEYQIRFHGIGSATLRAAAKARGLEPDECYCLGQKQDIPDLAIEVVVSSGLVDKLEIYRGLGVAEVWEWENGQFTLHHLRSGGYETIRQSELLPDCDLDLLASYVRPDQQFDAVLGFRSELQQRRAAESR